MGVLSPTRLHHCSYCVDFVTICTEHRVLSLPVDFRTKARRVLVAHKLIPGTIYRSVKLSLCDDRNWFASVHQARCPPVEAFKEGNCCAAQAFNYNKRDYFSIVAPFVC